jgi:hypothetical protein
MTKFRTGVAIAAFLIAAPAMACTDWKAIAIFDQTEVAAATAIWVKEPGDGKGDRVHEINLTAAMNTMWKDRAAALADTCGGQQFAAPP